MLRWPLRRSRGNSSEGRQVRVAEFDSSDTVNRFKIQVSDLTGNREPKKSILRTKLSDNGQYNPAHDLNNSSVSMIDIRAPGTTISSSGNPTIYNSVTSDFAGRARNPREKRSVLFLDQLVAAGRQASIDSASVSSNRPTNSDRLPGGLGELAPSFSSYPASYQPSPVTVRREGGNVPGIELISKCTIDSRRDSLDGGDGDTVSGRSTLRPSLPWTRKKTKKLDLSYSEGYNPTNRRTGADSTSASSTNLQLGYGPVDKLALDKSALARMQQPSGYNSTVTSGTGYNPAAKPPLPLHPRDIPPTMATWNAHQREQETLAPGGNYTSSYYSPKGSSNRHPMCQSFDLSSTGSETPVITTKPPSQSPNRAWPLATSPEVERPFARQSGTPPPQVISRPRVQNTLVELQQPTEAPGGACRLRRRVTLTYSPITSLPNGNANSLHKSASTVTPDAPRVIEIGRR